MIDRRFFEPLGPVLAHVLCSGAQIIRGDPEAAISTAAPLLQAGPEAVAFAEGVRAEGLEQSRAGLLFTTPQAAERASAAGVVAISPAPRAAFARACAALFRLRRHQVGDPALHPDAMLEAGVEVCAGAVIGAKAEIGADTWIGPNAVIGPGVAIGRRCRIGPGVVLQCALIGDDVVIGAGAVLGDAGFGVAVGPNGLVDVPHLGRAIVQDRASLGALVTVDRGQLADTIVGEGAKIDNLSQIAHNVHIGANAVLAAFAGISGSADIGAGARLGGRVGVADHVVVGANASLAAGSGLMHTVPSGETWGGYPAKPIKRWMREVAWLKKMTGRSDAQ